MVPMRSVALALLAMTAVTPRPVLAQQETEERVSRMEQAPKRSVERVGQTVFYDQNAERRRMAQVIGEEEPAFYAVPPDVYHSAARLTASAERPTGLGAVREFVTMPEARRFQGTTVRPFDRVMVDLVDGYRPSVGDEVLTFRVARQEPGLGWVVRPTGTLTVLRLEDGTFVGEVSRQFGTMTLGDYVEPTRRFPLERGQKAREAEVGAIQATILGWGDPHQLQQFGDVAFLDRGAADGVAIGDEFAIGPQTDEAFNDQIAGRLQVVRVDEERSSARIVQQDGPVFRTGTIVYLWRKMR